METPAFQIPDETIYEKESIDLSFKGGYLISVLIPSPALTSCPPSHFARPRFLPFLSNPPHPFPGLTIPARIDFIPRNHSLSSIAGLKNKGDRFNSCALKMDRGSFKRFLSRILVA